MGDKYLGLMGIMAVGSDLVFSPKGGIKEKSSDVVALEKKLDSFMASMGQVMENHTRLLEQIVSGLGKERVINPLALGRGNGDVMVRLDELEKRFEVVARNADMSMHESLKQSSSVENLGSQGGVLMGSGRAKREEMGLIFEATKALSMKVLNFDRCLTAQAANVSSCLDRLNSLEFRTRPGYIDPTCVRQPMP